MDIKERAFHVAILSVCPNFSGSYNPPSGPAIEQWDSPCPQPTQAQIDAAMPLARAEIVQATIRTEVGRRLTPTDFRFFADAPLSATFTQADKAALAARRAAVRDFGNTIDPAAINTFSDIAALPWPSI